MNTPKTLSLPLRAEWRPIDSSYAIKDASGAIIAYTRGGRSEEEALFLAHAASEYRGLAEALGRIVYVVNSAGALNLSNGVQLGQTSWYIKMTDALAEASIALEKIKGVNHDD